MDTVSVPAISPQEFIARLDSANAPLVLDVRRRPRYEESDWIVLGAQYCAPEDVESFARSRPPGDVVVYCVYGHNVSADAVLALRAAGWNACALSGGIEGGEPGVDAPELVAQWRAQPVPRVRKLR